MKTTTQTPPAGKLHIVLKWHDDPPGTYPFPPMTEFIEVEDHAGKSVNLGEHLLRPDGYTVIEIEDTRLWLSYQEEAARTECDYLQAIHRFTEDLQGTVTLSKRWDKPIRLNHGAIGIANEAGELCSAIQKWLYYGKYFDSINWKEEIGDLLWYIALICNTLGITIEECAVKNIAKLKARYPEKWAQDKALNRDLSKERYALESKTHIDGYDPDTTPQPNETPPGNSCGRSETESLG